MRVDGENGSMSIRGATLVIERRSNTLKIPIGQRTLPLSEVQSVEFQAQRGIFLGVLGVVPVGTPPQIRRGWRGRILDVNADTNITFTKKQQPEAESFSKYLEGVVQFNALKQR